MSPDSAIFGDLTIEDVAGVSHTTLCGISVSGNVSVLDNGIPIEVGSPQASCAENFLAGNLAINNNSDRIDVYKNLISGLLGLSCTGNNSIQEPAILPCSRRDNAPHSSLGAAATKMSEALVDQGGQALTGTEH